MDAWKRVGLNFFLLLALMMSTSSSSSPSTKITASASFSPTTTAEGPKSSSASPTIAATPSGSLSYLLSASFSPTTTAEGPKSSSASPTIAATPSGSLSTSLRASSKLVVSLASTKKPTVMVTLATGTGSAAVSSVHQSLSPSSAFNLPPSKSSFMPTGTLTPPQIKYPMIVAVTFKMTWGDLCPLLTLFKERLSQRLLEYKGYKNIEYYNVPTERIVLINRVKNCNDKSFYNEEAVLEFYITDNSTVVSVRKANKTDIPITIKAFKILYDYWVNHLMVRLHDVFRNQVTKVELIEGGIDVTEKYMTEITDGKRVGIGIGVCLAVISFLCILYFCWTARGQVKNAGHTLNNRHMVFTNEVACKEEAKDGSTEAFSSEDKAAQPVADSQGDDEPEEVEVHQQPQTLEKTSILTDNEDSQRAFGVSSGEKPFLRAPLAHPEPDNVSQEETDKPTEEPKKEPIVSPGELSGAPVKSSDEPEVEPVKSSDEDVGEQSKSPDVSEGTPKEDSPASDSTNERDSFTSSVTIKITSEESPQMTETESPPNESPPEPAKEEGDKPDKPASEGDDEEIKPDLGQSDHKDEDPTEGAINLAFEAQDEAPVKEKNEETKF